MSFQLTYDAIAKRIDHSLLGPALTTAELEDGCRLAIRYAVASVCIKPMAVALAARILKGSGVAVGTTIGFPHGGHATAVKVFESRQAMADGATELDMVINIGQAKGGEWDAVSADIAAVTKVAHDGGSIVKVIFENCFLNDDQKIRLCKICGEVGADYVKTSTGYGTGRRHDGRPSPDEAIVAAAREAEGRRRNSHARRDDRSRRSSAAIASELPGRPRFLTSSSRALVLEPVGSRPHARFDLVHAGLRADDQGVTQPDEEAGVEHAGQALQLTVECLGIVDRAEGAVDDHITAVSLVERTVAVAPDRRRTAELLQAPLGVSEPDRAHLDGERGVSSQAAQLFWPRRSSSPDDWRRARRSSRGARRRRAP